MNISLIISLILFATITTYRTRLGIYLILVLIPSFLIRTQISGIPTTFLELSIYLLAIIWFVKKVKQKTIINYPPCCEAGQLSIINFFKLAKPFLLPTLLFILAAIISTLISPDKRLSLGILKGWIFDPLLFTIIFIDQIKNQRHLNQVITSLSLMVLWISVYGIYEYLFNPRNLVEYLRLDSIFTSANYVTMLTMPITILILGYLIYSFKQSSNRTIEQCNNETTNKWLLPLLILTTSISVTTIYLTRSFSGWLGLGAGVLILLLALPTKKINPRISGKSRSASGWHSWELKTLVICIFIIFSTIFLYTQKNNPKIQSLTDFTGRSATHARLQIWQTSLVIIKDNPILGIGLGNFHNKYLEYLPKTLENPLEYEVIKPHNLYLNLWLEMGLLGLIAFIWLIIIFHKTSLNKKINDKCLPATPERKRWQAGQMINAKCLYIPAMAGLLVQGFFDTPYFKNDLSLIFWLIIAMSIVSQRIINRRIINNE